MEKANDPFCEAVDIIIKRRLEQYQTPQVIKGKISVIINSETGEYGVTYQGITLSVYAIAPNIEYKIGDMVYILLPNGDLSKAKLIVGADVPPKIRESEVSVEQTGTTENLIPITSQQIKELFESL